MDVIPADPAGERHTDRVGTSTSRRGRPSRPWSPVPQRLNRSRRWHRVTCPMTTLLVAVVLGCSAGDPPNPEAARTTIPAPADAGAAAEGPEAAPGEQELSDADDATLDSLEEQFEDHGVKDIRVEPGKGVAIHLEDELTIRDARPVCAAVRAAGFADVNVDIDGVVAPCP